MEKPKFVNGSPMDSGLAPNHQLDSTSISRRVAIKGMAVGAFAAAVNQGPRLAAGQTPLTNLAILEDPAQCGTDLKRTAARDYCESLSAYGGRLSNPIRSLYLTADRSDEVQFAVAIVGSGYGASICAARLSQVLRPGHRMCVLERGKEWIPGSFPDTLGKMWTNTRQQITGPTKGQITNPLGLYNVLFNDEVNVLSGSGLGGTSLINANTALRPHSETFSRPSWPAALRDIEVLTPFFNQAARQLSLIRTPVDAVPKVRIRRYTAQALSSNSNLYDRSPVAVMHDMRYLDESYRNPQSMKQQICIQCGDCISGCNVGAKNTLVYNYLPVAKSNGVEMYTQVQVDRIEREFDHYRLYLTYVDDSAGKITRHSLSVTAKVVILGAGSPGSAEILLASQSDTMKFAPVLGKRWSANGDMIGFVVRLAEETRIAGFGACAQNSCPVGTTVQTTLNFYDREGLENKFIVQEAAIPRGVSKLFGMLLKDRDLNRSMVMLGIGHDEARGELKWKDGRYQICWPGLKDSRFRKMIFNEFERIAQAEGGQYKRLSLFGDNLVTVHPLGGCAMADDPICGVVNDLGQVFDAGCQECNPTNGSPPIYPGLYVADASVIPTALGANPYLTICAVAERIAYYLVRNPVHADLFAA